MPVGGFGGAAPQRELGVEQHIARFAAQWEMIDQHRGRHPVQFVEPGPGVFQAVPAPGVAGGVRLTGQQELVGGDDVAFPGDGQAFGLGVRPLGKECVVIQQEHRDDGRRAATVGPHRIRMLRGEHTHLVAYLHQVVVARPAEHLHRVLAGGPQFVVSRHPDDFGESAAQQIQRPADVVGALGDIAGDDQPVLRVRRVQRLGDRLVAGMTRMQVADRPKGGCHRTGAYWRSSRHLDACIS